MVHLARGSTRFNFYPVSANNIRSRAPVHVATGGRSAVAFYHGWCAARTFALAAIAKGKGIDGVRTILGAPKPT